MNIRCVTHAHTHKQTQKQTHTSAFYKTLFMSFIIMSPNHFRAKHTCQWLLTISYNKFHEIFACQSRSEGPKRINLAVFSSIKIHLPVMLIHTLKRLPAWRKPEQARWCSIVQSPARSVLSCLIWRGQLIHFGVFVFSWNRAIPQKKKSPGVWNG